MKNILRTFLCFVVSFFRTRLSIQTELSALRHQLLVYQQSGKRPLIKLSDRVLWGCLYRVWSDWDSNLFFVTPETVINWRRRKFRKHWATLIRKGKCGRRRKDKEIRKLIRDMSMANPLWGSPRIKDELAKIGIDVAKSTVEKYMVKKRKPPSQTWKTFLTNHIKDLVSIDFFIVPTIKYKILFVLVVLKHKRRQFVHFNVTDHPSARWTAQQIKEAFPWDTAPKYMIHDRDCVSGKIFKDRLKNMDIKEVIITAGSPWQNAYAERVIGSIRRECLDHVIVLNEKHLRKVLKTYFSYYNQWCPHYSLDMDSPDYRPVHPSYAGKVVAVPEVGGLHHHYKRLAA